MGVRTGETVFSKDELPMWLSMSSGKPWKHTQKPNSSGLIGSIYVFMCLCVCTSKENNRENT